MHRVAGEAPEHSHDHHSHDHGHAGHPHDHGHGEHHHEVPGGSRPGRRGRRFLALLALAALLAWAYTCVSFVDETQLVLVTQLGEIVHVYDRAGEDSGVGAASDRGLHFKWPWPFQTTHRLDRRLQVLETPPMEMLTADPKNITIECYVCWKIADAPSTDEEAAALAAEERRVGRSLTAARQQELRQSLRPVVRFLKSVQSIPTAEDRLQELVGAALRNEIARIHLSELVSATSPNPPVPAPASNERARSTDAIQRVATRLLQALGHGTAAAGASGEPAADPGAPDAPYAGGLERMGIQIVDIRLKRFNLPEQNRDAVYGRMRSERQRIVAQYSSEGESEARKIRSRAQKEEQQILAYAEATAERIRGQADAEATRIYAQAHSRDPEFYRLLRTLEAYQKILNEKTTLVLSASSSMLRLLSDGLPQGAEGKNSEARSPNPEVGSQNPEVASDHGKP